jgi:hypothetical protein
MALSEQQVHVTSPCPIDLDETGMRGQGARWRCEHCSKTVHVLSSMTESEARRFLTAHAGQDVCVSYAMSPAGEIRFRPEPVVPVSSLVRPRLAVAAAIGFGVALAACAPHDNPRVEPPPVVETVVQPPVAIAGGIRPAAIEDIQVDGGMRPMPIVEPPRDVVVEGGIKPVAPTVAKSEPCDPPKIVEEHPPMRRGGVRAHAPR